MNLKFLGILCVCVHAKAKCFFYFWNPVKSNRKTKIKHFNFFFFFNEVLLSSSIHSYAVLHCNSFSSTATILDCLELRYRVRWPHTLILDDASLASYSRVWCFRASLYHSLWAADDVFCHLSSFSKSSSASILCQVHSTCTGICQVHSTCTSL